MARHEVDREDLLREATALVERAEIRIADFEETIVIGFRRDGCASVYLGADPAWHFNTRDELRRAYVDGRLLKAEHGRLVALTRRRTETEVRLVREELSEDEVAHLISHLRESLDRMNSRLADARQHRLIGAVPADVDVVTRIRQWLTSLPKELSIAASPHAR